MITTIDIKDCPFCHESPENYYPSKGKKFQMEWRFCCRGCDWVYGESGMIDKAEKSWNEQVTKIEKLIKKYKGNIEDLDFQDELSDLRRAVDETDFIKEGV